MSVLVSWTSEKLEDGMVEAAIAREFSFIEGLLRADPQASLALGDSLKVWSDRRTDNPPPAVFQTLPIGQTHDAYFDSRSWQVLKRETDAGVLIVALDITDVEAREKELNLALLIGCVLLILINAILAWHWSRRVAKPLSELEKLLANDQVDEKIQPLHVTNADAEILALLTSINTYRHRIQQQRAREQLFTAAVSHELRNPLAVISSSLELISESAAAGPITRAKRAATGLNQLTTSLLYLARENDRQKPAVIDVAEFLEQLCNRLSEESPNAPIKLSIPQVGFCNCVSTHLTVVLSNLIRNAQKSAPDHEVTVSLTTSGVSILDKGPGLSNEEFTSMTRLWMRGNSQGWGLGLHIAWVLAERNGWALSRGDSDSGLLVRVNLPLTFD